MYKSTKNIIAKNINQSKIIFYRLFFHQSIYTVYNFSHSQGTVANKVGVNVTLPFGRFTPLKIYNGTPNVPRGRLNRDLRATLPINELKGKPP
jgi:hypothetical protein